MLLDASTFFIREHVAFAKLTDTYDILDPATRQMVGMAREEPPGWAKWLRLLISKQLMPTVVNIYAGEVQAEGQAPLFSIRRGVHLFRAQVVVTAGDGRRVGYFKSKLMSIGGGFYVFDNTDQLVAEVKGDWKGWNFKFLDREKREIGTVTKKWSGLGKELFTSADNYMIALTGGAPGTPDTSLLLLAAGLAIDIVYKERK